MACPPSTPSTEMDESSPATHDDREWQDALQTLSRFAAMDTMQYASLLVNQKAGWDSSRQALVATGTEHAGLVTALEVLEKSGKFGNSSVPSLVQSVHRLHSNLAQWHHQDAQHADEMRKLQAALVATQERERKLLKQCKKLTKQNTKLRDKLREKRDILTRARSWFHESVKERESLQEIATAAQLSVHEHLMSSPGRIRLGSADSNFSDVDALGYMEEGDATLAETDGEGTSKQGSFEGSESQASLVTDDGIATLQFTSNERVSQKALSTCSSYTLEFPSGLKTGLRIKPVPVSEWIPATKAALSPCHLDASQADSTEVKDPMCTDEGTDGVAFVVCGHHNIDSDDESSLDRSTLPPVGARILAVRDRKIIPTWSLDDVLANMASTADSKPTFAMTFRNGKIVKAKNSKNFNNSDDDASLEEKKNADGPRETPTSTTRPFSMLHFGKSSASKPTQNVHNEEADASEIEPHKANSLMFWRHGDKAQKKTEDKTSDFTPQHDDLKESEAHETPLKANLEVPREGPQSMLDPFKPDAESNETAVKIHKNPLIFWKKDDLESHGSRGDMVALRPRMNTADSAGLTDATVASKEDASVASCPEAKTCASVGHSPLRPTPMKNLMFWRKSDQPLEIPEAEERESCDNSKEVEGPSDQIPESTKSNFSISFWNGHAKRECKTDEEAQDSDVNPIVKSAEAGCDLVSNLCIHTDLTHSADSTTEKDQCEGSAERNISLPDTESTDEGNVPDAVRLSSGIDESVPRAGKAETQASATTPIQQMGRFFSNPFAN